ncbi:MAG: hypothetical protein F4177_01770 [Chloroflexi bacterium]|nr:hypothetical protein [Chloroflexota bacterium]
MALLAETWAMLRWFALQFHPRAERRSPKAVSPDGWRGWAARVLYLGWYLLIFFGIEAAASSLPESPTFALQMAGLFVGFIVVCYSRYREADVRLLRPVARAIRMPWLLEGDRGESAERESD